MYPKSVVRMLAEVAETASETLELQQVFDRVANSIRSVIPFDNMGVVRILDGELAVLHATTVKDEECKGACREPTPLDSWSPRLRPRPEPIARVEDATAELDAAFPIDAEIIDAGVRSAMWEPFHSGKGFRGGIWLSSYRAGAFTEEHQELLRPIAALLGSAVEHWRIWDAERRRRQRLDQLEGLLDTLASALDVRQVFDRVSEALKSVLPHDLLVLTEFDAEAPRAFRIVAYSGKPDGPEPGGPIVLTEDEARNRLLDHEILRDLPAELPPSTERNRLLLSTGMRSMLRAPLRLSGEVHGSVVFFHREAGRFAPEDVEIARRLADRIALAVSHHRLAEEERVAAEARERAERLAATVESLERELQSKMRVRIIGASPGWKRILHQVGRVAPADTTVLITGESGTGKEIVSQMIHEGSPRAGRPFVAINCAALPEQLLESELFGHEKGAFTGAIAAKVGRLEQADGGTLFLDEIGEMSPLVQAKLLRVLQEREFQRLGGTRTRRVDVRIIAATNRDLARAIERGEFREDLFYRLNVFALHVPPLRERPEDVLLLAESFLEELSSAMGHRAAGISKDAREWLLAYSWPGNVRELRNAIERAILLCDGGLITRDHLPAIVGRPERVRAVRGASAGTELPSALPAGGVNLSDVDRTYVERALEQTRGNKSKAARLLGLSRSQLYSRLEKYGIH
jgi:transcriptional regulator with GAF, ATPase, and Fis domain